MTSIQLRDDLSGRAALVTGGSGGIGAAIALRLAEAGADVALTYRSNEDGAQRTGEGVRALGRRALVLPADLADPIVPPQMVGRVGAELGPVDVLVANAGTGATLAWTDVDLDSWQRALAVNTTAPWLLVRAALPGMVERRFGRVLLVSSVAALNGGVVGPHYAASKAALHGLVHHLAPRVAGDGVLVNAIAPAMVGGTGFVPQRAGEGGELPAPVPVGRVGTPEEVADLALATVLNGYVTGSVVVVDGGLVPH